MCKRPLTVTVYIFFIYSTPQNETPLPISAVAAEPGSRVQQGHKRALNFPEGQSPLDPLSVTPVKPKRHQKGRLR